MPTLLFIIPLTVLPLILCNIIGWTAGAGVWDSTLFTMPMISGARWAFTVRDLMIVFGLACLYFEVLKSTSSSSRAIINHSLSTVVLIVFLIEFLVVPFAAHSVFFILTLMALFDVVAGFSITIKAARRDLALGQGDGAN
jgi:hypothetical protein